VIEEAERLSADDMATRTEAAFLASALAEQRTRAAAIRVERGVCNNCGEGCQPHAVYCDAACRDGHERRLAARARTGAGC